MYHGNYRWYNSPAKMVNHEKSLYSPLIKIKCPHFLIFVIFFRSKCSIYADKVDVSHIIPGTNCYTAGYNTSQKHKEISIFKEIVKRAEPCKLIFFLFQGYSNI